MSAILPNGLSVSVMWAFCVGVNWADPVENAREHVRRMLNLRLGDIQTEKDLEAITSSLTEHAALLRPEEITLVMRLFFARQRSCAAIASPQALAAE